VSARAEQARSRRLHRGFWLLAALASFGCSEAGNDTPAGSAGTAGAGGSGAGSGGSSSGAGGTTAGSAGTAGANAQGGGPGAEALEACRSFCAAEEACDPDTTLSECETATCVNPVDPSRSLADSPVDCQEALTSYWACLAMASDPCNRDNCPGASDAVVSACF
jgi:hypothetical protein